MIKFIRKIFGREVNPTVPPTPEPQHTVRPSLPSVIRLGQLRRNEAMVGQVRAVLGSTGGMLMLEILQTEALSNYETGAGMAPHEMIRHLGRCEGYRIALNNIRAMTIPIDDPKIIAETYGVDNDAPYPPRPNR